MAYGEGKIRILLLAYFFPPCNITASQRSLGWAKYFYRKGFYPVIVTRKWERPIKVQSDGHYATSAGVQVEKHEHYEVHYLPYLPSLRDRIYTGQPGRLKSLLQKVLTFFELFGQHFSNRFIPFRNFYDYSLALLKKDKSIKAMVVTANPFTLFRFAHLLHKETGIPWVADYRDDWNTRMGTKYSSGKAWLDEALGKLETKSELQWLSSCSAFSTISVPYRDRIAEFIGKRGVPVYNGFIPEDFQPFAHFTPPQSPYNISYVGTLIEMQRIEIFIQGFLRAIQDENIAPGKIRMRFIGTGYDDRQANRVHALFKGYEDYYEVTPRMERSKVIQQLFESHALLMVAYGDVKGAPGTKTFDYLACNRRVVLCPSDNDLLEEIFSKSGLGSICNNSEEVCALVKLWMKEFAETGYPLLKGNQEYIGQFTRMHQTDVLADLVRSILPDAQLDAGKIHE
jgi:glycosyltransferase involved in cell wall biosynthesis